VIYLVSALMARGHDCTLVCPPSSGVDTAARERGIHVRNLFCAGDLDLPFAYRLTQYINESKPDLVHCHSRRGADVLGGLAASFADVPAVVSRRVDSSEMQMIAALRYRPFKKIIAISDAIAEVLRSNGVDAERITVIRSAVDPDAFATTPECSALRREFDVADDAIVLGAAGQLIERKGYRYLLDTFATLRERHAGVRLLIFGEGPLETELRDQAAELGLDDVVDFPGFRPDLDSFIGCFDLFVHPAVAEGLGVVTLKAQAAGVPVVGFMSGGVAEAVLNEQTGLLVPPGDVHALSDAISRLIDDVELRKRMSAAGRARMRDEFSIAAMTDRHVDVYEQVLGG
jgi:glycosyltransferase involved in cell wall biosynthesis